LDYNNKKAVILAIVCTIFTSAGQILWKKGIAGIAADNLLSLLNWPFILGFVAYGLGAALMLLAFKYGDLSLVYPFIATSYVWVLLLSWHIFGEMMNTWKWSGVMIIIISVSLLGYGSAIKPKKYLVETVPESGDIHG
jgi:undecaprenyl phosphate-alpha-L-ara4N flippase subunit ArnE